MANSRVMPGPELNELLWLAKEHRAYSLFENNIVDEPLNIRRSDQTLWSTIRNTPIPESVMTYIRAAGFGGVFDCGYKLLDHSLITALVERWRPETHTFHLPIGEATVTLQDVQVMWGLSISGEVITGSERRWNDYNIKLEKCRDLLGVEPTPNDFNGSKLRTSALYRELGRAAFPDNATNEACMQRARLYILLLLGGVLFADTSDSYVHMFQLELLADFDRCSLLSWGSAVLACLYRNLCKAASPDAVEMAGPVMLLQLWAWSRMPSTSPINAVWSYDQDHPCTKPYGFRWNCPLEFGHTATHSLMVYRDRMVALHDNEFIWTPYHNVLASLPTSCKSDSNDWVCDTVLIYWEIVEECQPSRVMRQFHYVQTIPGSPRIRRADHKHLHNVTRRGASKKNWRDLHAAYIRLWSERLAYPIIGVKSYDPSTTANYMSWYWPRTVLFIKNPRVSSDNSYRFSNLGGTVELTVDGLSRMHQGMGNMMGNDPNSHQYIRPWLDMSQQYLHLAQADDRINYRFTHVVDANTEVPDSQRVMHVIQRVRRQRGRGRGRIGEIDINVAWDPTQEEKYSRRPRRNRRASDCGTGGRQGHNH